MKLAIAVLCCCLTLVAQDIRLVRLATGLSAPVDIQSARDGSGRLFLVELTGRIRIHRGGALLPTPFLDLRDRVVTGGERGLLGLAFPPGFPAKGHFYVNYTEGTNAPNLRTVIARFRVSASNPDFADPASEERILVLDQPYDNHNAGQLAFSPRDGFLYIGTGDGGSGGDPENRAQSPSSYLGKMLRIDSESGSSTYSVPASNPFLDRPSYRPEIWATGLRNPWRFSFDRDTGDLYIADVGQNTFEEVNFQPGSSKGGENYGWRIMEAAACYNPPSGCVTSGLTLPVFQYGRDFGNSITGGYVWRGSFVGADYGSGRIFSLRREAGVWKTGSLLNSGMAISSFGQGEAGELYLANLEGGEIYKIIDATPLVPANGVVNSASSEAGLVAGSLATIYGNGVSGKPGIQIPPRAPLPSEFDGTRVWLNDLRAPILAVANVGGLEQVNFQVPWELAGLPSVNVSVERDGKRSAPVAVAVAGSQPGIFATSRPASDVLTIWATGLGPVDTPQTSGAAAPILPLVRVAAAPEVIVDGRPAELLFAGLAPTYVGLYQINVRVPAGTPAKDIVIR